MVNRFEDLFAGEFYEKVPQLIASGDLKLREHIYKGLAAAPQAIYDVQKGNNTGKVVVVLE
jgi:NADPH-dependent curcumin reductase CurA